MLNERKGTIIQGLKDVIIIGATDNHLKWQYFLCVFPLEIASTRTTLEQYLRSNLMLSNCYKQQHNYLPIFDISNKLYIQIEIDFKIRKIFTKVIA